MNFGADFANLRRLCSYHDLWVSSEGVHTVTVYSVLYHHQAWAVCSDASRQISAFDHQFPRGAVRDYGGLRVRNAKVRRSVMDRDNGTLTETIALHHLRRLSHAHRFRTHLRLFVLFLHLTENQYSAKLFLKKTDRIIVRISAHSLNGYAAIL